jgi:uncharacterized caspase-like protein
MKKLAIFLAVFLVSSFAWAQQNSAPQKFALVIGNGNYTSFGSLPNAVNDANDMTTALQGLGFNVDKVLDGNRVQMIEAITRFKNRLSVSKNSYGFFFYAGHGVQFNGMNYLIPAKAEIPSANYLADTSISVQTMLAELNDAGNELNIVVLDACRDFPAAWSRTSNRGLTVVGNQPADSIIVFATSAGSTAADGTGRNGLFTSHLLNNLKTPGLEVSEVFRRTGSDVARASSRQQIPAIYNQFFETAYLGTKPTAAVAVQPTPAPAPAVQPAPQSTPTPAVQPAPQPTPAPAVQPAPQPASTQTYKIGDRGPAGGIIFYDKGNNNGGWRYLEAAPVDLNGPWSLNSGNVGGTRTEIGSGKQNTELIIAALNQKGESGGAAQLCRAYTLNGYSDWFLPSKDELNLMYKNLKQKGLGGLSINKYWSSSQGSSSSDAWVQIFGDGRQFNGAQTKNYTHAVRAVRAF